MVEVVDCRTGVFVVDGRKAPAVGLFWVGGDDADGEDGLEAFELTCDGDAVGEGAEEADVEVVAVRRRRERGRKDLVTPCTVCMGVLGHGFGERDVAGPGTE